MKYQWVSEFMRGTIASLVAGLLLGVGVIAAPALALTLISAPTSPVMGRAPTASSVAISSAAPTGNETVTASWIYNDADGDLEKESLIQWLFDHELKTTGRTYTVPATLGKNRTLQARVTPRSAPPAYPLEGVTTYSAQVTVVPLLARFKKPDNTKRRWPDANRYCQELSPPARLPTLVEMQALFLDSTSAISIPQVNNEMCDLHGWPLSGKCGGNVNFYWTSDKSGSRHYDAHMHNGNFSLSTSDLTYSYVACVLL